MRRLLILALAALALIAPAGAAAASLAGRLAADMGAAGGQSGAYVIDLTSGRVLFDARAGVPRMPASVEKIYTVSTALAKFGPSAQLVTSLLGSGTVDPTGTFTGELFLRGGGDPTFGGAAFDRSAYGTGATLETLLQSFASRTGIRALNGAVVGDETFLDSRRGTAPYGFTPAQDIEGELSGLAFDRGFANFEGTSYQAQPALYAARQLVSGLRQMHVNVPHGTPTGTGPTPPDARLLASVSSPSMASLARLTLAPSDNFLAEMLLKDLGARFGTAGSSAAGAAVVRAYIAKAFGIHPALEDGSGLSRRDLTSPRDVVTALAKLARNGPFVSALAVAGRTGTLVHRMRGTAAAGRCRAKTGTLHDASELAGLCLARNGHTLAFAFLMNGVDPVAVHPYQDDMAIALASW